MSSSFLASGLAFLALSLLTVVLAPLDGGHRTVAFVGWLSTVTLWIGLLLVAAHLLQLVLRDNRR